MNISFPDIYSVLQDSRLQNSSIQGGSCHLYFYEENSGMLFIKQQHRITPLLLIDDGSERALADIKSFSPQLVSPKQLQQRFSLCVEKFLGQRESGASGLPVFSVPVAKNNSNEEIAG